MYKNDFRIYVTNNFSTYFYTLEIRLQIVFFVPFCIYTRNYIYLQRLVTFFFPLMKLTARPPYNFRVPDLRDRREKKVPLHSYVGAVAGARRTAGWEPLSFLLQAHIPWWGPPRLARGKGVSRGAACRSRAYFSPVANTVSASVRRDSRSRLSSFDRTPLPHCFSKAARRKAV